MLSLYSHASSEAFTFRAPAAANNESHENFGSIASQNFESSSSEGEQATKDLVSKFISKIKKDTDAPNFSCDFDGAKVEKKVLYEPPQ